jgi:hypothetical protein
LAGAGVNQAAGRQLAIAGVVCLILVGGRRLVMLIMKLDWIKFEFCIHISFLTSVYGDAFCLY